MTDKWMQGAVQHPGALHRHLGIPETEKIPAARLAAAAHSADPTIRREAVLAETFRHANHAHHHPAQPHAHHPPARVFAHHRP